MSEYAQFNENEKDCLQELMNISYGAATAAIADIINKEATLSIPNIQTVTTKEFKDYLKEKLLNKIEYFITNQLISGSFCGETMFVIDRKSTENLALEFDLDEDEVKDDDELKDVILEISNIITSTTLSKLAGLIETSISFSPPQVEIVKNSESFYRNYINEYDHIIIISTDIIFKEQNISGELLILSKDEATIFLKEALNRVLEEF
ncbi:chemotaxis protein CheX [Halarcobacter bivalviorum]|uniref:Chemotaxis protein CheC n=1 Tax=Halarcobacter bivalviorum TaxID=663364 RepID=A0AAX2AAR5_9BACT|nr:chemotaxis protein CheX [Halarcobacter bivalviorum]AXH13624.1 response regulator phosphatase [Halarcobacter bivalviorum]RXK09771.1 chemotaxis protein CheC [Halarcobacter bivalviorum]